MINTIRIGILGGGPSSLFMFKRFVDAADKRFSIHIFEKNNVLGAGMPYSSDGALDEHVTNVSGNEIPELVTSLSDWVCRQPKDTLDKYRIKPADFNDYKVLPRLLFGQYLTAQYNMLLQKAKDLGLDVKVHYRTMVADINDLPDQNLIIVTTDKGDTYQFDKVVVSTGHNWPRHHEGDVLNWFDAPYPPQKIALKLNGPVAIKGSSLTAIDALRTLSRYNGDYEKDADGILHYTLKRESENFRMVMHSRNGLLPAVRFHLEDSHLSKDNTLSPEEIAQNRKENNGFLSLDYVFEGDFKKAFKSKRPDFYEQMRDLSMEQFVEAMMGLRENADPFELIKAEYVEAERSIKQRKSVYWKEMLAILSFAMNYPAKHFSAEDMLRLQKTLMPLISVVIAFVPQSSVEEILALHQAGVLAMVTVGADSSVDPVKTGGAIYNYTDEDGNEHHDFYETFVDCVGQPHFDVDKFPYETLTAKKTVAPAKLLFQDSATGLEQMNTGNRKVETDGKGNYYLNVPGIAINDSFQVTDGYGALNERLYMMAVPYIGGYNPDYSGLDFCEAASETIMNNILNHEPSAAAV